MRYHEMIEVPHRINDLFCDKNNQPMWQNPEHMNGVCQNSIIGMSLITEIMIHTFKTHMLNGYYFSGTFC